MVLGSGSRAGHVLPSCGQRPKMHTSDRREGQGALTRRARPSPQRLPKHTSESPQVLIRK